MTVFARRRTLVKPAVLSADVVRDLDETRRLLLTLDGYLLRFERPSAELVGTLSNALVYHSRLLTRIDCWKFFFDIERAMFEHHLRCGEDGPKSEGDLDECTLRFEGSRELVRALVSQITKRIGGS